MWNERDMKIALHWIQCCMILHNMTISFKEELGIAGTTEWARQEGMEPGHRLALVVVDVAEGTPGQVFRADLMRSLFTHLGMLV
jgi:hypothetical protein